MTSKIPVLIGITGKRDLKGQDVAVRRQLAEAFDRLDRALPHVQKVLLSGLAVGADTIAAELALERPTWLVAAILPMAPEIYLDDFAEEPTAACSASPAGGATTGCKTQRQTIEALLSHPKMKVRTLLPLSNPATGYPCSAADLHDARVGLNRLRVQHYEQLGLWLADMATLLIAVMPADEKPDQLGGTARVVHYRLTGRPDSAARAIMQLSAEICEPLPLDIAGLGPLWLIDLPRASGMAPPANRPFEIRFSSDERRDITDWPFARQLRASLTVARGFDRLALLTRHDEALARWPAAGPDAEATVRAIHHDIAEIQRRHKSALVKSTCGLAILFLLAVVTYGYIELSYVDSPKIGALSLYLGLVAAALILHWTIERKRWQRIAEDYRGVSEALRVQRAWWHAGNLDPAHRVDRFYLVGAEVPILYLRRAVRNIIGWALLYGAAAPAIDWQQVCGDSDPPSWLREQLAYFRNRGAQRKRYLVRTHMLSWELFFSAQFLATWLFGELIAAPLLPTSPDVVWWSGGLARGIAFLVVAGVMWALRHSRRRLAAPRRLWAAVFALLMALLIGPGLHFLASALAPTTPSVGHIAVAMAVVLFSASAVALRFVADKLAWEAEAHRYEDALTLFERAEAELGAIDLDEGSAQDKLARKQKIVLALGRAALEQNEYWLRAHRERPIEVAVG